MSAPYWDWWQGALALGGLGIAYRWSTGRPLGVSGVYTRLLAFRAERARDLELAEVQANAAAYREAMLAATVAAFGPGEAALTMPAPESAPDVTVLAPPPPVTSHALFIAMMFVGALVASALSGGLAERSAFVPSAALVQLWGGALWPAMLIGGVVVGFGTRMAGGCTSGHGLSGCARLVPSSLLATVVFFGTAVVVSLGLARFAQ